jgi:hypothetical protein
LPPNTVDLIAPALEHHLVLLQGERAVADAVSKTTPTL